MTLRQLLTASALTLVVSAQAIAQGGPPPARVRVDAARMETVEPMRRVTGELVPTRRSSVASKRDAQVIEVLVDRGDTIEAGQIIARLDAELAMIDLQRAEADLKAAEALIAVRKAETLRAERDLARTRIMLQDNAVFQTEVEDRETDFAAAQARLRQAEAEAASSRATVADARKAIEDMVVVAPYTGQVVDKLTEVGQWVREGDGVIEIIEVAPIDAWLDVPEQYLPALRNGSSPTVQILAEATGHTTSGKVTAILAQGDALGRKFPVRVRLENTDGALLPGMSIVGVVPTGGSEEALTIHKDAVLRNAAGAFVYFDGGGVATVAPVEIQYAVGNRFVIRSPMIRPGTSLIIEGNERMYPGQPLTILSGAPESAPAPEAAGT